MKLKLLATVIVATVMGTANPVYAQSAQPMYYYYYYANGQQVGAAEDLCTNSGVVTHGRWLWGYASNDVTAILGFGCLYGQWVPLD